MNLTRIHVLCAVRDPRLADALLRRMDERCRISAAYTGEQAVACALRDWPDVLIVDAVLPELDGVGVLERLRGMQGGRSPVVIGGSVDTFADAAFLRLGAAHTVNIPWDEDALVSLLSGVMDGLYTQVDWRRAQSGAERAQALLREMGMSQALRGYTYLAWAAALTALGEERLYGVRDRIYVPVAERFHTTPQSVERLIRHAVERTADTLGAQGIYTFFGNTIDPMRGKPTNAQMIGMLGERVRIQSN